MQVHRGRVFNTDVELAAVGVDDERFLGVEQWLTTLDKRFSRFRKDNELAVLNNSQGKWVSISHEMERLLAHALNVSEKSRGLVNIATTRSLLAAGYQRSWPAPWKAQDLQVTEVSSLDSVLEVKSRCARLAPGESVDFGAIAKGLWADDAVRRLGRNAIVSLGGDISARGDGPQGAGWPIALPGERTIFVKSGGVATSGITKRKSTSAHHIIDPSTGKPAETTVQSVTTLASSASTAEWAATALIIDPNQTDSLIARRIIDVAWVQE